MKYIVTRIKITSSSLGVQKEFVHYEEQIEKKCTKKGEELTQSGQKQTLSPSKKVNELLQ